jgi:predicted TIM-barrel fold metal-dependent hydrolase
MSIPSLPKLGTPPAPAPLRKIALEEHFGHPIVFMRDSDGRFETRKEAAVGHLGPEYFEVVQERLLDFNTTRLQAMDEAGVDKVLLSFGAGFRTFGVQGILDRVEAQNTARIVNYFLAEQVSAHPSRYVGMATLANWGFAPETATHALRIVYSGVFDRFPTAKLVLGHLGESLPFLAWRIQHGINFSPNGRSTKKRLIDYFADNIWVTTSGNFNTQALHCTMLTMGADRILLASDYLYKDYIEAGEFMDTVPIGESDRRKITYGNAKALYKL